MRIRRFTAAELGSRAEFFDRAEEYTPYLCATAGGARYFVRTEDRDIGRSLFAKQTRGEHLVLIRAVAATKGLLGSDAIADKTFIDVGANIGTTTIPALTAHGFDSAIALEPEPENVRLLRLNGVLNDLQDRITVLPVAASNQVGQSELVVDPSRGGKHWITAGRGRPGWKRASKHQVVKVETVTLDHLVAGGVIDPERTGMLWIDAEAHEGHILEGAGLLVARGTPLVLELKPTQVDRETGVGRIHRAIADVYTHFASMHRDPDPLKPSHPLRAIEQLPAYASATFDPVNERAKTDVLVLRLTPEQADGVDDLDRIVKPPSQDPDPEDGRPPGLLSRARDLFGRV